MGSLGRSFLRRNSGLRIYKAARQQSAVRLFGTGAERLRARQAPSLRLASVHFCIGKPIPKSFRLSLKKIDCPCLSIHNRRYVTNSLANVPDDQYSKAKTETEQKQNQSHHGAVLLTLIQVRFILRTDDETASFALDPLDCNVLISFAMPPFENLERIRSLFSILNSPLPSAHGNAYVRGREMKLWQINLSRSVLGSRLIRI